MGNKTASEAKTSQPTTAPAPASAPAPVPAAPASSIFSIHVMGMKYQWQSSDPWSMSVQEPRNRDFRDDRPHKRRRKSRTSSFDKLPRECRSDRSSPRGCQYCESGVSRGNRHDHTHDHRHRRRHGHGKHRRERRRSASESSNSPESSGSESTSDRDKDSDPDVSDESNHSDVDDEKENVELALALSRIESSTRQALDSVQDLVSAASVSRSAASLASSASFARSAGSQSAGVQAAHNQSSMRELLRNAKVVPCNKQHEEGKQAVSSERDCIICLENVRNIAVQPCGHLYMCSACATTSLDQCRASAGAGAGASGASGSMQCAICKQEVKTLNVIWMA